MILGIDVSTYLEELQHGAKYYDGKVQIDPLDKFIDNGVNYARIRLWNNPFDSNGKPYLAGTCDINYVTQLALLMQEKGYSILLDFQYSDFWADPGKQYLPKAWANYNIDKLELALYDFTAKSLTHLIANGVTPKMIQVGNEITNGICWPLGRLEEQGENPRTNYENLCRLLKAGIKACRQYCKDAVVMLHLERSYDQKVYNEFFTNMEKFGVDYDAIGMSYYPHWHHGFDEFFANVDNCKKFGKQLHVVEFGYGFTLEQYLLNGNKQNLVLSKDILSQLCFTPEFDISPSGQAQFVKAFVKKCQQHGIDGIFYWEPLWTANEGICWASVEGQEYINEQGKPTANEWANQCLFDYDGKKLPAFDEYKK